MTDIGKTKHPDIVLCCEDSEEGILTGIYEAYALRRPHDGIFLQTDGTGDMRLFAEYMPVAADGEKSAKVLRTLRARFREKDYDTLCFALSSHAPDRAQALYRTVVWGLSQKGRDDPMGNLCDSHVRRVAELGKSACNEWDHLRGFLRFEELENGILCASASPKNNVIPLLGAHFSDRLPGEDFVIRDVGRDLYVVHPAFREWFLVRGGTLTGVADVGETGAGEQADTASAARKQAGTDGSESYYSELFSVFCHTISIEDRKNLELQRHMLPLRFREYMTEFR